ncbi:sugar transporter [Pseudomonas taiwanensis]|nr:sugar transporter [Pseudomonas taiwanensis]
MLCFFQVIFFFLSAAFQAKYSVSTQLKSVGFQVVGQLLSVYLLFNIYAADFRLALIGLGIGYAGAVGYLFWAARLSFGVRYEVVGSALKSDFRKIFKYGYALMPWMLGALILTNIDRFSIGYYEIANGSAYLSLKDLFVGAGGLISMPLLMVVHSFIIDKFRQGSFGGKIIDGCLAYLILFFSICWCVLQFLGFEIFERFTGKVLLVPHYMLFMAFLCVFLNCASVYLQKRLEVHCRLRRLAIFSLASAVVGGLLVFLGGRYWGLLGVAIGSLIAHIIYFVLVLSTTIKKLDLMRFLWVPLLMSLFAFLSAYMIDKALRTGVFAEWWVIKAVWTILFTPVVFLAFWKGIQWKAVASEFTSR